MSETERPHAADLPVAIAAVERLLAAAAIHSDTVSLARVLELNEVLNVLEERIVEPTERLKDIDRRGLRAVVEASAKEPHADVVLHALHVSGGAGALASSTEEQLRRLNEDLELLTGHVLEVIEPAIRAVGGSPAAVLDSPEHRARVLAPRSPPTSDPADKWIAWRESASDFVTDMRAVIPSAKLDLVRVMLGEKDPPVDTAALARAITVGPANVAAFVLKAPALDRLLLVRSGKPGRAWELPGGCVEPGETPADAAVREVVEEAGIYFRAEGGGWTVEGCEVFRGTSSTDTLTPGGDAVAAWWFTPDEARLLPLSDLPTAALIRQWLDS